MITASTIAIAAAVGATSGTHAAIWGMYKDSAHEGFDAGRFSRSVVIGGILAVAIHITLALVFPSAGALAIPGASALVLMFGLAYAAERGVVETWKTFLREENQSKYTIPMQFSIRGVPVSSRRVRLAAGAAYVMGVSLCLYAIGQVENGAGGAPNLLTSSLVGLAVGMVIAVGGAWKDAPTEGFDPVKFFRSPAMTVFYTVLLATFTGSYLEAAVAAIGFERATAETYKKFFFPSKAPGKFEGKPILFPEMLSRRQRFVPAFVAIWAAVVVSTGVGLVERGKPVAVLAVAMVGGQ